MIGSILLLSDTEMIRIFAGAASALSLRFRLPFPSLSLSVYSSAGALPSV